MITVSGPEDSVNRHTQTQTTGFGIFWFYMFPACNWDDFQVVSKEAWFRLDVNGLCPIYLDST